MFLAKNLLTVTNGGGDYPTDPVRFDYTGSVQAYTVPNGCRLLYVEVVAGSAGNSMYSDGSYLTLGGKGGKVECNLAVTSNQTLYIYVGGKGGDCIQSSGAIGTRGWNGGEQGRCSAGDTPIGASGGGGATDIRTVQASFDSWYDTSHSSWDADNSLLSRLIVAGGGGGITTILPGYYGAGHGGGLIGGEGWVKDRNGNYLNRAYGGTQDSGGTGWASGGVYGTTGFFGKGADGNSASYNSAGGAGGGWYGGGDAGAIGGGGSSYTNSVLCSNVIHTQGFNTGNGYLVITPI